MSPSMSMQHMHQPIKNDMIHSISSHDRIGSSILTSLALHRCVGPSVSSYHSTCPSHLQPALHAKSCLDLLHLDHMTRCHVTYAISFMLIIHLWTNLCVSHINTISLPKVVTQLPKPTKDLLGKLVEELSRVASCSAIGSHVWDDIANPMGVR